MYTKTLLAALSGLALTTAQVNTIVPGTTGKLGDVAITEQNPQGVTYQAILPDSQTSGVRGYVAGTSNANGTGVQFNINIYGLPDLSLGPFMYHIHDQPIPTNGSCAGALAHLDTSIRGEKPPCDPTTPEKCQTGDLSGKHGNITGTPFQTTYLELYVSTLKGPGAFFGNRSIVVHSSNATRLNCANFTLVAGNETTSKPLPSGGFTGAAAPRLVSLGVVVVGVLAFFL